METLEINKIQNAANAHCVLQSLLNSTDSVFKYEKRFNLDWELYKGKTSFEAVKSEFDL